MKKKLLITSITSMIIIVLASYSNVVGKQTITDAKALDSPLFTIRTQRIINNSECKIIESKYIGQGEMFPIVCPIKYSTQRTYLKVINAIRAMDDEIFIKFVNRACNELCKNGQMKKEMTPSIKEMFQYIREDSGDLEMELYYDKEMKSKSGVLTHGPSCMGYTCDFGCLTVQYTPMLCENLRLTFLLILPFIFVILYIIRQV